LARRCLLTEEGRQTGGQNPLRFRRRDTKLALGSEKHKEKGCRKLSRKLTIVLLFAVALSLSLASVAFANGGDDRDGHNEHAKHYKAHLKALNRSGAEGHAILEKEGNKKVETEIQPRVWRRNCPTPSISTASKKH
jgi:hypothetical protein